MKKSTVFAALGILILAGAFKCPLYAIFGIPCPTCGMTRAWRLFLTGKIAEAFKMHPLFLLPAAAIVPKMRRKCVLAAAIVLFAAVYLIRMTLLFPGSAPMNFNYDSVIGELLR